MTGLILVTAGCGAAAHNGTGASATAASRHRAVRTTTSAPVPSTALAATAAPAQTIQLLSLYDVSAGWVDGTCVDGSENPEQCQKPGPVPDGVLIGYTGFQNSDGSPTADIEEDLYSFPSAAVAEADTSNPKTLLGSALAKIVVPMSFPGVKADQVSAFTLRISEDEQADYIIVRDNDRVGVFSSAGDTATTTEDLSAIQAVTN
jgi:hypothetical protein